jgi:hypothetical protein
MKREGERDNRGIFVPSLSFLPKRTTMGSIHGSLNLVVNYTSSSFHGLDTGAAERFASPRGWPRKDSCKNHELQRLELGQRQLDGSAAQSCASHPRGMSSRMWLLPATFWKLARSQAAPDIVGIQENRMSSRDSTRSQASQLLALLDGTHLPPPPRRPRIVAGPEASADNQGTS